MRDQICNEIRFLTTIKKYDVCWSEERTKSSEPVSGKFLAQYDRICQIEFSGGKNWAHIRARPTLLFNSLSRSWSENGCPFPRLETVKMDAQISTIANRYLCDPNKNKTICYK